MKFAVGMLAGDRERAAELIQDAMVRLLGARGHYAEDADSMRRYAFRVLSNLCLDELRRRRSWDAALEQAGQEAGLRRADGAERPDDEALRHERRAAVSAALEKLPARERAALLLREMGGESYCRIAEELGLSMSEVNNLIHRARTRFARLMRPWVE
jgi:RNA polymerase sigma-70 factor (ECF subfamily)